MALLENFAFSVAQAKLVEFLREHRARINDNAIAVGETSAKITFGEALKIHQRNQSDNVEIKPSTLHYWNQIFAALLPFQACSGRERNRNSNSSPSKRR